MVSGTALDVVLARRVQRGDPDGKIRRAMAPFPDPSIAGARTLLHPRRQARSRPAAQGAYDARHAAPGRSRML
jgi:hypothetical protein